MLPGCGRTGSRATSNKGNTNEENRVHLHTLRRFPFNIQTFIRIKKKNEGKNLNRENSE